MTVIFVPSVEQAERDLAQAREDAANDAQYYAHRIAAAEHTLAEARRRSAASGG